MPGRWEMYPRNTQNTRKESARIRGTNCRKSTEENEGNKEGSPTSFSDTVSRVIQPRARRAPGSSPQPSVNNSAEPEMKSSEKPLRSRHSCHGRIALGGSRSFVPHPTRIQRSLPARPAASVPTSERTKAREAPGIRSTHDGATMHNRKANRMKNWKD